MQSDAGRIVEAYRHAGRDDVGVKPVIIDRGNDRVDLVFEVTEGAKTPVRQINFVGNKAFGHRQLAAVIKTSATNMLSFITGGDVYDPDIVAADREQLRTYYRSKGYADAGVPSALAEYDPATKGFTLTFTIDEGPIYHFGDVNVDCHVDGVDPEKLRRLLLARSGALFDGTALDRSDDALAIDLAKLGYPFAHVQPRTTRDATAKRIDVAFEIDQGPRAYVERIDIHGNTRTRGYVIRREFDIAEGDAFNKGLIDRAERRLKNLNYFKTVKIAAKPGSVPDRVILDVEVVGTRDRRFQHRRRLLDHRRLARRGQAWRQQFHGHRRRPRTPPSPTANMPAASICRQPIPISSATAFPAASIFLPSRAIPAPTNPTAPRPTAR